MYFVFIDESGQSGGYDENTKTLTKGSSKHFTLAGFIVSSDDILDIEKKVKLAKVECNLPVHKEFKWNESYKSFGIDKDTYISFRKAMLSIIASYPNSVIASVINKEDCYKKAYINNHNDLYVQALHLIMERVKMELIDRNDNKKPVMFVFDSRKNDKNNELDKIIQQAYIRAIGMGTFYLNFPNFLETAIFADSDYSAGVQIADYCAGPIQQVVEVGKKDWYELIKPAIRKHDNEIKGYGVKIFP